MADYREVFGPGVSFYGTPTHSGFHVTGQAILSIPPRLRRSDYSPYGWFEEDCDWAIVALCFPSLFPQADPSRRKEKSDA
mgnify:FL=1